ncbi:DUF1564 family protein [Leptospira kobayashii]|uniref:DUF1564 family protein n=1 Tax=Leptospira kobayashii TaxID=1917830 RepID=UPI001FA73A5E|nr:DUF1564 family protein [Leptospira kobayashii]
MKKGNPKITYSTVIRNLLEDSAYFIYHGFFPKRKGKVTRTYQKQGLDLKKVTFRIDERYLIEMDLMASALSISRSHLLGLLLEWREMGWLAMVREFGIVRGTPFLRSVRLTQTYDLKTDRYPTFKAELLHNANSS